MRDPHMIPVPGADLEAHSIEELLDKLEVDPFCATLANVCHVFAYAPTVEISEGRIAAPCKDTGIADEIFCNTHLAEFCVAKKLWLGPSGSSYLRWTNRPDERRDALARTIRPSLNHVTQKPERGLSVARGLWHYYRNHSHCYFLSGDQIARGSDAEPILDIATLVVESGLLSRAEALKMFYDQNRASLDDIAAESGAPAKEVFALVLGMV